MLLFFFNAVRKTFSDLRKVTVVLDISLKSGMLVTEVGDWPDHCYYNWLTDATWVNCLNCSLESVTEAVFLPFFWNALSSRWSVLIHIPSLSWLIKPWSVQVSLSFIYSCPSLKLSESPCMLTVVLLLWVSVDNLGSVLLLSVFPLQICVLLDFLLLFRRKTAHISEIFSNAGKTVQQPDYRIPGVPKLWQFTGCLHHWKRQVCCNPECRPGLCSQRALLNVFLIW